MMSTSSSRLIRKLVAAARRGSARSRVVLGTICAPGERERDVRVWPAGGLSGSWLQPPGGVAPAAGWFSELSAHRVNASATCACGADGGSGGDGGDAGTGGNGGNGGNRNSGNGTGGAGGNGQGGADGGSGGDGGDAGTGGNGGNGGNRNSGNGTGASSSRARCLLGRCDVVCLVRQSMSRRPATVGSQLFYPTGAPSSSRARCLLGRCDVVCLVRQSMSRRPATVGSQCGDEPHSRINSGEESPAMRYRKWGTVPPHGGGTLPPDLPPNVATNLIRG